MDADRQPNVETPPVGTPPLYGHYAQLRPDDILAIRKAYPIAFVPWGALDWHGPHLPLGADGLVAESVAEQVMQRTGGVLMPTTWWADSVSSHHQSIPVRHPVLRELWTDMLSRLAASGWQVVVIVSGHYTRDYELLLMETAERAIRQHNLMVLAVPPLALIDHTLLDHAALWETSLLMSLYPQLVDLYALGEGELTAEQAVRGRDPRGAASASLGDTVLDLAVERLAKAVSELLTNHDPLPLLALYEKRRELYLSGGSRGQGTNNGQ